MAAVICIPLARDSPTSNSRPKITNSAPSSLLRLPFLLSHPLTHLTLETLYALPPYTHTRRINNGSSDRNLWLQYGTIAESASFKRWFSDVILY